MAAIDKIYGSVDQWNELNSWLRKNLPEGLKHMYSKPEVFGPLSNFPQDIDMILEEKCPLDFVQERLKEQYNKFSQ